MLPRARKKELITQRLDEETLVYDLRTNKAHCLNLTASLVWRYCDGKTTIAAMAKRLSEDAEAPAKTDVVRLALSQLAKAKLLDENSIDKSAIGTTSRREVLKNAGKTAIVALPLITSLLAPEAVQAASCVPGPVCATPGRAFSGRCCCTPAPQHKICTAPGPSPPATPNTCVSSPLC